MELRDKVNPGEYSGYLTLGCGNANPFAPEAAIFSGTVQSGSVLFLSEKTVMTNADGCAFTSFIVTPFGSNEMSAEFHEGKCDGGRLILRKSGR